MTGTNGHEEAQVLRLVDTPASFVRRLVSALPGASIIYSERGSGPMLPKEARGIAILYERAAPDRQLVAAMCAIMPTLVVAEQPRTEDALACLDSGADGYLDAELETSALRSALLGVAAGELAYSREITGQWLRTRQHRSSVLGVALTTRDREILALIAGGATDKEIAAAFGAPKSTIQKQIARLLRRIGARNRAAAVALSDRLGA